MLETLKKSESARARQTDAKWGGRDREFAKIYLLKEGVNQWITKASGALEVQREPIEVRPSLLSRGTCPACTVYKSPDMCVFDWYQYMFYNNSGE